MLMVRGYVTGKRSLVLSDKRANEIRGDAKVSSFKLSPTGDSSISIVDDEPQRFLQIVSEIRAPASSAAKVAEDAAIGKPTAPAAQVVGRIFVQQDWRDDPANGAKVVELLRQHDLLVVAKVERIPSQKMPSTPQVRYFNVADLGMAQRVAGFLEGADLKVRVVRIALPSPSGQLEVWLRKIGS
jgi:hypothetical protein